MATKDQLRARLDELNATQPPDDATHASLSQAVKDAEAKAAADSPPAGDDTPKGDGGDRPVITTRNQDAQDGRPINPDANPYPGGVLNPDAPKANQDSTIRDAEVGKEKPAPDTIAQVEEVAPFPGGNADDE